METELNQINEETRSIEAFKTILDAHLKTTIKSEVESLKEMYHQVGESKGIVDAKPSSFIIFIQYQAALLGFASELDEDTPPSVFPTLIGLKDEQPVYKLQLTEHASIDPNVIMKHGELVYVDKEKEIKVFIRENGTHFLVVISKGLGANFYNTQTHQVNKKMYWSKDGKPDFFTAMIDRAVIMNLVMINPGK